MATQKRATHIWVGLIDNTRRKTKKSRVVAPKESPHLACRTPISSYCCTDLNSLCTTPLICNEQFHSRGAIAYYSRASLA